MEFVFLLASTPRTQYMAEKIFTSSELYDAWPLLSMEERIEGFEFLQRDDADNFFLQLSARDRMQLLLALPIGERRFWIRLLAPDDAADVIQEAPAEERENLLALLDDSTRREVKGLLDYAEDEAGGLMNTALFAAAPDMTVDEAISYLRQRRANARDDLLCLRARCRAASSGRRLVSRSVRRAGDKRVTRRDAHRSDFRAR